VLTRVAAIREANAAAPHRLDLYVGLLYRAFISRVVSKLK
jgi:hypothetical protein